MASKILAIALVFVAVIALTGVASAVSDTDKVIQVSGTGSVSASPDLVKISLSVETENTDSVAAQRENAEMMDKCINALKGMGISSDDLKTTGYNMYSYTSDEKSLFGGNKKIYKVQNTLLVTSNKVDEAGKIIDTAAANGANNVNSIRFSISDEVSTALRSQALNAAVSQARADADAVASALGVRIVDVLHVDIGSSYTPYRYALTNEFMMKDAAAPMSSGGATTAIEYDDVDVTATVSITYIIN